MAEAEEQLKKLELEKAYQSAESASIKEKVIYTQSTYVCCGFIGVVFVLVVDEGDRGCSRKGTEEAS